MQFSLIASLLLAASAAYAAVPAVPNERVLHARGAESRFTTPAPSDWTLDCGPYANECYHICDCADGTVGCHANEQSGYCSGCTCTKSGAAYAAVPAVPNERALPVSAPTTPAPSGWKVDCTGIPGTDGCERVCSCMGGALGCHGNAEWGYCKGCRCVQ